MPDDTLILARDSYLLAVELRVFWLVAALHGASAVFYFFHAASRSNGCAAAARGLAWASIAAAFGLLVFRAFSAGRPPFATLYESTMLFVLAAPSVYIFSTARRAGTHAPGLLVSLIAFGACLYALLALSPATGPVMAQLKNGLHYLHTFLEFSAYALFAVSASFEAYSIARLYAGEKRGSFRWAEGLPLRLSAAGFALLSSSMAAHALWSWRTWGTYLSLGSGEAMQIVVWGVFAAYLHAARTPLLNGIPASILNIIGFVAAAASAGGTGWILSAFGSNVPPA